MTENDGVYQQLRGYLAALKLPAIAEALAPALEQAEQEKPGYTRFLADLLQVEVQATQERALTSRLRLAGFPQTKTLEEFVSRAIEKCRWIAIEKCRWGLVGPVEAST